MFQFKTVSAKPTRQSHKLQKLTHFVQKVKQDSLRMQLLWNLQKRSFAGVFQNKCSYKQLFKNSFLCRTPLIAASGFLTKLAENNFEENHSSVNFFSEISYKLFLSLCYRVSKNHYFTGFLQFLSFFKHARDVSRTHLSIKMEPIAKIVDSSRGVFRTKWKI